MRMVKNEFIKRVGGDWNIKNKASIIGSWYTKTYLLRNKVAHEGYFPSGAEATEALIAASDFRLEIVKRIETIASQYEGIKKFFIFSNDAT